MAAAAPVSQAAALVNKAFLWQLREQRFTVDAALLPLFYAKKELKAGTLLVRDAYDMLPLGSTLVLVSVGRNELVALLDTLLNEVGTLPQLYGLRMAVDMNQPAGSRVSNLALQKGEMWQAVGEFEKVRLVVPSVFATKEALVRPGCFTEVMDTGLLDNAVLTAYLRHQKTIKADTSLGIDWRPAG